MTKSQMSAHAWCDKQMSRKKRQKFGKLEIKAKCGDTTTHYS